MAGKGRMIGRDGALVMASAFFYIVSMMTINPLMTGYVVSLGATSALAGGIAGALSLCSLACRPPAGRLSDRLSRRGLAAAGVGVMALSSVGYAFVELPWQVGALRLVNGVGYSLCSVCVSTWFASMLPRKRIGSGMGVFGLMNALAMAVGPSLGIALNEGFGYRVAMLASAGLAACSLVCILLARGGEAPAVAAAAQGAARRPGLLSVPALPAAVCVALFTIPYCAAQSFLVQYVADRGLGVVTSIYFPVYSAALVALRLGLGKAFDSRPFGLFVRVSCLSEVLALVLLSLMRGNIALGAAGVFMAGGYGVMCSVSQAAAVRLAGAGNTGLANSTYYVGLDVGMMLGPALAGALYEVVDLAWLFPAFVAFPVAAVAFSAICRRRGWLP